MTTLYLGYKTGKQPPSSFSPVFFFFNFCSLKPTAVLTKVVLQCANCAEPSRLCQRRSMEVTHAPLKHKSLSLLKCSTVLRSCQNAKVLPFMEFRLNSVHLRVKSGIQKEYICVSMTPRIAQNL